MDEPSLLDYLKERLNLRRILTGERITDSAIAPHEVESLPEPVPVSSPPVLGFPWRSLLALVMGLIGQRFFEPGALTPQLGIGFYFIAFGLLVFALLKGEWRAAPIPRTQETGFNASVNKMPLFYLAPLLVISFFAFSGNRFSGINLILWTVTLIAALAAFWQRGEREEGQLSFKTRIQNLLQRKTLTLHLNWWTVLIVAVFAISAWFHLSQLNAVPLDMTSDHAEKILDVNAVLNSQFSIFFPRNSGREPLQFYLTAALVRFLGQELGFTTLKLGMAVAFLVSLVYVNRLGKEIGSRWTGLFALLLVGIAAWTNILARSGMRLVLTPVFVAPVLFYLLRGLRLFRRNDLILAGIFLGFGLMGYSAFRIMPLVVLLTLVIFLVYHPQASQHKGFFFAFGVMVIFALIMALPLLRFTLQYPELIAYRTVTRMTGAEQTISDPILIVFLRNFWNASLMPFWRNGNTWVISVINRPALDLVSASLYLLGIVTLIYTWLRQKVWQYLALLIAIPVLMLPSIFALAFPLENPSLSRAGGAIIPILLAAAVALESIVISLWRAARTSGAKTLVVLTCCALLFTSAVQNHDLVFNQYRLQYQNATWNTKQMGEIARNYVEWIGSPESVFVLAVPHWVDTRLVAMNAGFVDRDFAIWADDLESTTYMTEAKLFFVKASDTEGMEKLIQLYPSGFSQLHNSPAPGREFYTYLVPPAITGQFQN